MNNGSDMELLKFSTASWIVLSFFLCIYFKMIAPFSCCFGYLIANTARGYPVRSGNRFRVHSILSDKFSEGISKPLIYSSLRGMGAWMTPDFWPCAYDSKLLEATISLKPPLCLTKRIVKVFLHVRVILGVFSIKTQEQPFVDGGFHVYSTLLEACITLPPPPSTSCLYPLPPPTNSWRTKWGLEGHAYPA
jgi:hypothetical protein